MQLVICKECDSHKFAIVLAQQLSDEIVLAQQLSDDPHKSLPIVVLLCLSCGAESGIEALLVEPGDLNNYFPLFWEIIERVNSIRFKDAVKMEEN